VVILVHFSGFGVFHQEKSGNPRFEQVLQSLINSLNFVGKKHRKRRTAAAAFQPGLRRQTKAFSRIPPFVFARKAS
jgi:hypothetical protein